MESVTSNSLKKVLADTYAVYLKTQNYHWNVTGPFFSYLHELFEEQYTDLAEAVDEIAERIRALGVLAPGGFKAFSALTSIEDAAEKLTSEQMLNDLIKDHNNIVKSLKLCMDAASSEKDEVTVGMMTERLEKHEKYLWMLKSSTI